MKRKYLKQMGTKNELREFQKEIFIRKLSYFKDLFKRKKRGFNRIFCVGVNKSGTTSLHEAFRILGLTSAHHKVKFQNADGKTMYEIQGHQAIVNCRNRRRRLLRDFDSIERLDAFSDMDLMLYLSKLDSQYPNSKFIYHFRERESWIDSKINHIETHNLTCSKGKERKILSRAEYRAHYDTQNSRISNYFKGRDNLLIMNIIEGDGWEKLCPFLGLQIPAEEFPNKNKGIYNTRNKS